MPSSRMCVGDLADDNDQVAWRVFTLMFTPVTSHHLHRLVASVVHGTRRCPELQLSDQLGPILCDRCADHVDAYRDTQFRKWRDAVSPRFRSRSTELAQLVDFVRASPALHLDAAVASAELLVFANRHPTNCPQWIRWAFFQLVHRPHRQVYADLGRREVVLHGGSARPERDLLSAKWAREVLPDQAQRALVAEFAVRLRDGAPNPWQVHGAGAVLRAALAALRTARVEFYNANVAGPMLRRGLVSDAGQDLDRAWPVWASPEYAERPEVNQAVRHRSRTRIEILLAGPPRTANRIRRLLGDLCDTAFDRRTVGLVRSAETQLRLTPSAARTALAELGRLVLEAEIDWVDDRLASADG